MLGLRALLCAVAPGALAGMYGQPVVNLDGKTFKQALSVEHAAVCVLSCLFSIHVVLSG